MSDISGFFRGGESETARVFAQRLEELQRTGCSILVTGTVDETGFAEQLRRSFGSRDCKQVLVSPYTLIDPERVLPRNVGPGSDTVRVVGGGQARRATVAGSGAAASDGLGGLSDEVLVAVDELSDEFDLGDNDLRVGVRSLDQLSDSASPRSVRRFVRTVARYVGLVNGTLYCQFRDAPERADSLLDAGLFDARIELQSQSGRVEQRWQLLDEDTTTDWVVATPTRLAEVFGEFIGSGTASQ